MAEAAPEDEEDRSHIASVKEVAEKLPHHIMIDEVVR